MLSPQAVWYLKCRALTLKNWIDDTEIEEEVGCELKSTNHMHCMAAGADATFSNPSLPESLCSPVPFPCRVSLISF